MKLSEAITIYLDSRKSTETAKVYSYFLREFLNFVGDINIEDVKIIDVTKFSDHFFKKSTEVQVSKARFCLRSLLKYFRIHYGMNVLHNEHIVVDKPKMGTWKSISMNDLTKLFQSFDQSNITELRNLCICMTVFCTGVRSFELLGLTKSMIDWERGEAEIIGKGRKKRTIYFTDECLKLLQSYIARRTDSNDALFVNHCPDPKYNEQPIHSALIRTYMPQWGKKVGIDKLHCHRLRKSFGTELYRKDPDIRKIQILLGHDHVNTTQVYVDVDQVDLKEFHNRNMGETNEFCLSEKKNGNIIYEIKGFCCDGDKLAKLKKAIKLAADEILS